jgi:hypothetical protein
MTSMHKTERNHKNKKNNIELQIDKHGSVKCDGEDIYLLSPKIRIPFGIEIYGNNKVANIEFIEDIDDDTETRRFMRKMRHIEEELERQLFGDFQSSVKAPTDYTKARMRTRLMTEGVAGTITSEFYKNGREIGAYEIQHGETGKLKLKLKNVWTMATNGIDMSGAIWVIVSGDLDMPVKDFAVKHKRKSN